MNHLVAKYGAPSSARRHRRPYVSFRAVGWASDYGSRGGNSARWLNHACAPNCETIEDQGRIFIYTLRPVDAGEELFIDYLLAIDNAVDEEARAQYMHVLVRLSGIVGRCWLLRRDGEPSWAVSSSPFAMIDTG